MKNLAASIHARLAQRRAKTGEDFNVLLVRFTLERLLYRLSRSQQPWPRFGNQIAGKKHDPLS